MSAEFQPSLSDHGDYARALEVIAEASDAVMQDLGQQTLRALEALTHFTAVGAPKVLVKQAEAITYMKAVVDPQEAVQQAEEMTRRDATALGIGARVEEYLANGIGDDIAKQAQNYLAKNDYLTSRQG